MMFLQLLVGGHLLLLLTRTKKAFWAQPHPSWQLLGAVVGTQIFAVLMCGFGWLVPVLPWDLIAWVWVYNLLWMIVQDGVKLGVYRIIDHRAQHRQLFATHAGAYLQHVNQAAQPVSGA